MKSEAAQEGPLARELATAVDLSLAAGALVLRMRGSARAWTKDGDEPVTQADKDASALIVEGLARAFPGDAILSEEAADDVPRRLAARRVWMVDPIDGTRDYMSGRDGFAVMIGLLVDGRPALGAVYHPTRDALFTGVVATRSARLRVGGEERPLRVSDVRELTAIRLVASRSHRTGAIDKVRQLLGITDELNLGSVGLKIGLIATGERDLYVNPSGRSKAWDTCGPEAILMAAGGRLTDLDGRPLSYVSADVANRRGLVASNGIVHDAVLERISILFPTGS